MEGRRKQEPLDEKQELGARVANCFGIAQELFNRIPLSASVSVRAHAPLSLV